MEPPTQALAGTVGVFNDDSRLFIQLDEVVMSVIVAGAGVVVGVVGGALQRVCT